VRRFAITNLPSVSSLKALRGGTASFSAPNPLIGFADPVFSIDDIASNAVVRSLAKVYEQGRPDLTSLRRMLPQLPETAKELREVARMLKANDSDLFFGPAASVTSVRNAKLDQYRIIYFATHALVAGEVEKFAKMKAEPALVMSIPVNPVDIDNGLLSASEVAQLRLNADWVVLSACNTAAAERPGAEALSGLARAFFYAGAKSMLVSHWEVESEATVRLMTEMFLTVSRDPQLSHAEALQYSILTILSSTRSDDDAHPRYWAPFVVVGEQAKPK
jgi:CHAT domain-containing protein